MLGHEEAVIPSLPDSFQESEEGALLRKETSKKKRSYNPMSPTVLMQHIHERSG
jgi:hypothetical protein